MYSKGDKNYMEKNFPRLDAVVSWHNRHRDSSLDLTEALTVARHPMKGFEWTPRGNTRMSWEEGYDLLVSPDLRIQSYPVPSEMSPAQYIFATSVFAPSGKTAFGRLNGHFNVPDPVEIVGAAGVDRKSNEFRLYKWVESLHGMYRSYRLGRKSGSLTEDRVNMLSKIGFQFREE